jgi:anthranilate phosphoribosyltransferase
MNGTETSTAGYARRNVHRRRPNATYTPKRSRVKATTAGTGYDSPPIVATVPTTAFVVRPAGSWWRASFVNRT